MSLGLTPQMLVAVYDCLREFAPFKRWQLPPGDEVEFHVKRVPGCFGQYIEETHFPGRHKVHVIHISPQSVGHMNTLIRTMGHEMVHMHQAIRRSYTKNTMHNAQFHGFARRICEVFGWDYKEFV